EAVRRALDSLIADLSQRAESFRQKPDVQRSLAGGGIAVNRVALFSAARQALEGASAGTWVGLTDPNGHAQAWWGDAPASLEGLMGPPGLAVRWSATTVPLAYKISVGAGADSGRVCVARTLPSLAPDFGRALGLPPAQVSWEPTSATDATTLWN